MTKKYDFLIIGSGVAGMSYAFKVAEANKGKIAIICKTTLEEAITKIQGNTRRYCRKQLTWFKKDAEIKWFQPENIEEIINYIESNT